MQLSWTYCVAVGPDWFSQEEKKKLFVMFIDFTLAYDLVGRHILIRIFKYLDCGIFMLGVIGAMYSLTESIVIIAVLMATLEVHQGHPTSCLLFIMYVHDLIRLIKRTVKMIIS